MPGALPPAPAAGPRSPYDPVFNPIIAKATPGTQLQSQAVGSSSSYSNMQTVSANSNGVITTYNSPQQPGASSSGNAAYNSGSTGSAYTNSAGAPSSSGSGYVGAASGPQSQSSAYSQGGQQQQQSGYGSGQQQQGSSGQQPSTQQ
jgi:hypothetical protein